jgi:hypothetical protein
MPPYISLIKNNINYALNSDEFFSFRLVLSLTSILWAIFLGWTLVPDDGFTLVSPTQVVLNSVMDAHWWMVLFAVQGTFGITGVLLKAKSKMFIIFDSLLGALLWNITTSIMVVSFLHDNHNIPPIWAPQIVMSLFSIWALIRNNYGTLDE